MQISEPLLNMAMCVLCQGSHFGPPTGEHKIGVHVLLSELLGHVQPQRAIFVVDVAFCDVREHGVSIVELLELLGSIRVLRVLVWMIFQSEFPVQINKTNSPG